MAIIGDRLDRERNDDSTKLLTTGAVQENRITIHGGYVLACDSKRVEIVSTLTGLVLKDIVSGFNGQATSHLLCMGMIAF
jgi:hypothetical protein